MSSSLNMAAYRARLKEFEEILNAEEINLKTLKKYCFNGIPNENDHRALCWRLLLNYLPPQRCSWSEITNRKRELYRQFIEEMIINPGECDGHPDEGDRIDVTLSDHPLNCNPDSLWQTFFKDNEVLLQIDKDVRRLCPEISFFQQPTEFPCQAVVHSGGSKRLHRRVQHSVLKSANVERKGLGVTRIFAVRYPHHQSQENVLKEMLSLNKLEVIEYKITFSNSMFGCRRFFSKNKTELPCCMEIFETILGNSVECKYHLYALYYDYEHPNSLPVPRECELSGDGDFP